MDESLKEKPLKKIVEDYFSKKYEYREITNKMVGDSGQKWHFDAIVQHGNNKFGVFVKDWDRSLGVNQVRLLEKACLDMGFAGGLLVANNFSSHAKVYGKAKGVQLVSKSELIYKSKFN